MKYKMNDLEVNKIIAEFMGGYCTYGGEFNTMTSFAGTHQELISALPTESLDVLVPVWEKLDNPDLNFHYEAYEGIGWFVDVDKFKDYRAEGEDIYLTMCQAAAYAAAKAIKTLPNKGL